MSFDKIEGKGILPKKLKMNCSAKKLIWQFILKDLETNQPEGLCIAAVPPREDPADCLLVHPKGFDSKQI